MHSSEISVVIPTYNRAHCIVRALDSVLVQSTRPLEIIVVDDASCDDTATVLARYGKCIRYIRHKKNAGASAARNTGIEAARGEWIAFLDSDDAWQPQKLGRQVEFMAEQRVNACCTNCELIWPSGQVEKAYRPYPARMGIDHYVWGCFTCPGSTLIARRSLLKAINGYNPRYPRYEDWDLFLRLAGQQDVSLGYLNEYLATSWRGSSVDTDKIEIALDMLKRDHLECFSSLNRELKMKFLSALAFSHAANLVNQKRYLVAIFNLVASFIMRPLNNDAIDIVLKPYLRRRLSFIARMPFSVKSNNVGNSISG